MHLRLRTTIAVAPRAAASGASAANLSRDDDRAAKCRVAADDKAETATCTGEAKARAGKN